MSIGLRKRMKGAATAVLLGILAQGCATSGALPLAVDETQKSLPAYRLDAGDRLRITVYNEPNLSGEYSVSSMGEIAFPLIGMVDARGLTLHEVTLALTERIGDGYMTAPRVSVEVLNYRPYYILGEVQKPGQYPYVAGITIEQAVAAAGGFNYRANARRVHVRRAPEPAEKSVELGGDRIVAIMPGDTIRVLERHF